MVQRRHSSLSSTTLHSSRRLIHARHNRNANLATKHSRAKLCRFGLETAKYELRMIRKRHSSLIAHIGVVSNDPARNLIIRPKSECNTVIHKRSPIFESLDRVHIRVAFRPQKSRIKDEVVFCVDPSKCCPDPPCGPKQLVKPGVPDGSSVWFLQCCVRVGYTFVGGNYGPSVTREAYCHLPPVKSCGRLHPMVRRLAARPGQPPRLTQTKSYRPQRPSANR
ncbi:hypothetical protein UC8_34340 [Roseimaritima ulvae]|uniref:Uncharacterized protein n=1 Tax=Roseimaritima ulvae TaxID=980254 RepID=A0A5B9R5C3_9BACT|nr:hypothetical protein UC8_34340 [Roseimaritima ulvae]